MGMRNTLIRFRDRLLFAGGHTAQDEIIRVRDRPFSGDGHAEQTFSGDGHEEQAAIL